MLTTTAIPYLTRTFGAARGCSMGCSYCSTARWSHRLRCPKCRSREVHFHPERLGDPARAKRPQVVGVSFYDELFDPDRSPSDIDRVLAACEAAPWHQYVFLTKRPEIAVNWCLGDAVFGTLPGRCLNGHDNWWVGVTAEGQKSLDARAPTLLGHGIRHLWLSAEPLLGPLNPVAYLKSAQHVARRTCRWTGGYEFVAAGCLSGFPFVTDAVNERECLRGLVKRCREYEVAVFVKQVPIAGRCSRDPAEWPEDLQVQELPPAWQAIVATRRSMDNRTRRRKP